MRTRVLPWLVYTAALSFGTPAAAHSLKQEVGAYADNQGLTRQRMAFDLGMTSKGFAPEMTDARFDLQLIRDQYSRSELGDDEFAREYYGTGQRANDQVTVTAAQVWDRITETRVLANYATDGVVSSRTFGAGASQWYRHETVRVSVDLSRTIQERPFFEVLDYDFKTIGEPTHATSTGTTVAVRHLATPTTIVDYSAGYVTSVNRPATRSGEIAVRQFVPALEAAFHGSIGRAVNRGVIGRDTTYGQVDAWIGEVAYLQELWRGGRSRVGYRYYKEDETTRVYEDEKVFGSDTVSVGFVQDIPKDAIGTPLVLEAAGARYATNTGVLARTFELGVKATF